MTKRKFFVCKIIAGIAVGSVVGASVSMGNWQVPVILVTACFAILLALRRKVEGVVADERDYNIAGKASYLAIMVYSFIAVISGIILFVLGQEGSQFKAIGNTLLYSACFLALFYSVLFKIYARKGGQD